MNERKQKQMVKNWIAKHGTPRRLAPDARGTDEVQRESDLFKKKVKVKVLRERNKRKRALKLLDK